MDLQYGMNLDNTLSNFMILYKTAEEFIQSAFLTFTCFDTSFPSEEPTEQPTEQPSEQPSEQPTEQPSEQPTLVPTELCTAVEVEITGTEEFAKYAGIYHKQPYWINDRDNWKLSAFTYLAMLILYELV